MQSIDGRPIGRSEHLLATRQTWENFYNQKLPAVDAPWWAHRETTEDTFSGVLWIDGSLPHFTGHFPGQPILPGVVQIEWALRTSEQSFSSTTAENFVGMSQIKFKAPVLPRTWLQLNLTLKQRDVMFELRDGQSARTQGRLHYNV
jgi:3-hydroxymyristoyl/3-hydroxydecanoyl-(acyl carrier protein) dehydratase